ncbi:MAG: cob(I)yrinic acid a,c-diamide adenosyltransferase [Candidatus Aenigmarchaeota archaeon]|nr:cob(I)yrinic acid a,c-diamide adenosyltransferase [Candidatus Aenigmarchaeota archaeon]
MGFVCIFTGDGKGKTFSGIGMAIRFLGHGKKVAIVQFLKGRKNGEVALRKQLPQLEIIQFGTEEDVDLTCPSEEDVKNAKEALFYSRRLMIRAYRPDLLVLDEVNTALSAGMIEESAVLELMKNVPDKTSIVLTGNGATDKMVEIADVVTEMKNLKKRAKGKKGE